MGTSKGRRGRGASSAASPTSPSPPVPHRDPAQRREADEGWSARVKVLTLSTLGYADLDEGVPRYFFFWITDVLKMFPFRWIPSWAALSRASWPYPRPFYPPEIMSQRSCSRSSLVRVNATSLREYQGDVQ